MRPALDPTGHRVPRTKPTCLFHTWRPHRQRPFALAIHLHQHDSSRNLHLQYLAKNQSTQRCQSLITQGSDHPPVLEPHLVLTFLRCYKGNEKISGKICSANHLLGGILETKLFTTWSIHRLQLELLVTTRPALYTTHITPHVILYTTHSHLTPYTC
jgi:hypothetical protein